MYIRLAEHLIKIVPLDDSFGLPATSLNGSMHGAGMLAAGCLPSEEELATHGGLSHLVHGIQSHRFDSLVGVGATCERV